MSVPRMLQLQVDDTDYLKRNSGMAVIIIDLSLARATEMPFDNHQGVKGKLLRQIRYNSRAVVLA